MLCVANGRSRGQNRGTHHSAKPRVADRQTYPVTTIGSQSQSTQRAWPNPLPVNSALGRPPEPSDSMLLEASGHVRSVLSIFRSRDYLFRCKCHINIRKEFMKYEHLLIPQW
jgi:hypothetical protein